MSKLLEKRPYYKPFDYPWMFEVYKKQNDILWRPEEVHLDEDKNDWDNKLTNEERNLLTQLFRFFTNADVDIAAGYIEKFLPTFKLPECRMMLGSFVNTESIHQHGYSYLLDEIGMPELEYKAFQEYEDMKAKHKYLEDIKVDTIENLVKALAIYSGFGEGLQLFSSFAMLLNFPRFNKMKSMGQIVSWSIRDEQLHIDSMIKLFHILLDENRTVWKSSIKKEIYQAAEDMVGLENKFIDLCFEQGDIEGLTKEELKNYIKYIGDRRLLQLGLKPIFKVKTNPLDWLEEQVNSVEHTNFFEQRATAYSAPNLEGRWEDVWN